MLPIRFARSASESSRNSATRCPLVKFAAHATDLLPTCQAILRKLVADAACFIDGQTSTADFLASAFVPRWQRLSIKIASASNRVLQMKHLLLLCPKRVQNVSETCPKRVRNVSETCPSLQGHPSPEPGEGSKGRTRNERYIAEQTAHRPVSGDRRRDKNQRPMRQLTGPKRRTTHTPSFQKNQTPHNTM